MTRVLKNKNFWFVLFLLLLGLILRISFIAKPDGLWNDEYVSWFVSAIPLGKDFWVAVYHQCHMPLYYFYLKFFLHFFGNNDTMLRYTSAIPGVLSIISMYFVGKEFKDEKLGILCASVASLSSFLIYFSQEVRFYSLLFLFSSLLLFFTLRLIKNQNPTNILFFILVNALVIFTHTIGFVFVLFNLIFTSFYMLKQKGHRKNIFLIWVSIILLKCTFLHLLISIFKCHSQSQFWGHFTLSRIGFLFTDYFSPVLTNLVSAPDNFFYDLSIRFLVFALIPTIIAIVGIAKSLTVGKKQSIYLALVALAFLLVLVMSSLAGKTVFVTKYTIEVYPILMLLMCFGLLEFNKFLSKALIFLFCFLNLFYMLISPVGAPKIRRNEGHKIVSDLLKNANLKKGDFILLNYYPEERFEKYFDFKEYNVVSINKANFPEYLDDKFEPKFKQEILDKIHHKQKLVIIILNDVAIYSPMQVQILRNNQREFKKVPYMFFAFSSLKNQEMKMGLKNLKILRFEEKGSWSAVTFVKR